jgi:DMSO/TMAO reductase YedYZ molybdopterin-dependent catalytic subunit
VTPAISRGFRGRRREESDGGYGYHNYGDPWKEQRYTGD